MDNIQNRQLTEINQVWWDERVPLHLASSYYDVKSFVAGRCSLPAFEITELGDVSGLSLLHLQCHFGMDTLSWARLGAQVAGLDFSAPAIEAARLLADATDLTALFVQGDVYDAPNLLHDQFDIVYTGKGALGWLPDLGTWADIVVSLLRPGGTLYLSEYHPISDTFAVDSLTDDLQHKHSYFGPGEAVSEDWAGSYATEGADTQHNRVNWWVHPMGEIVSVLTGRGLRLEFLHEFPFTNFQQWPLLERDTDGIYRLPADMPALPLMFSLRATLERPPPR